MKMDQFLRVESITTQGDCENNCWELFAIILMIWENIYLPKKDQYLWRVRFHQTCSSSALITLQNTVLFIQEINQNDFELAL